MGYRHYLYKVKKDELNKIRNMTNSDIYIYTLKATMRIITGHH